MVSDATGTRRVGAGGKSRDENLGKGRELRTVGPTPATGGQTCTRELVIMRTPRRRKNSGSSWTEPAGASDARFWLIAGRENGRMEALTLDFDGDAGVLPVFSSEEEAVLFLRLEATADAGWRVVGTTASDLVSVLLSLSAERVALDPLPTDVGGEAMVRLVSLGRERFLISLGSDLGLPSSPRLPSREDDNRKRTDVKSERQVGGCDREVAARSYYEREG